MRNNESKKYPLQNFNRKEGNDQESVHLPNSFRSKEPKGQKDELKVTAPPLKHYKRKAKRTVYPPLPTPHTKQKAK